MALGEPLGPQVCAQDAPKQNGSRCWGKHMGKSLQIPAEHLGWVVQPPKVDQKWLGRCVCGFGVATSHWGSLWALKFAHKVPQNKTAQGAGENAWANPCCAFFRANGRLPGVVWWQLTTPQCSICPPHPCKQYGPTLAPCCAAMHLGTNLFLILVGLIVGSP